MFIHILSCEFASRVSRVLCANSVNELKDALFEQFLPPVCWLRTVVLYWPVNDFTNLLGANAFYSVQHMEAENNAYVVTGVHVWGAAPTADMILSRLRMNDSEVALTCETTDMFGIRVSRSLLPDAELEACLTDLVYAIATKSKRFAKTVVAMLKSRKDDLSGKEDRQMWVCDELFVYRPCLRQLMIHVLTFDLPLTVGRHPVRNRLHWTEFVAATHQHKPGKLLLPCFETPWAPHKALVPLNMVASPADYILHWIKHTTIQEVGLVLRRIKIDRTGVNLLDLRAQLRSARDCIRGNPVFESVFTRGVTLGDIGGLPVHVPLLNKIGVGVEVGGATVFAPEGVNVRQLIDVFVDYTNLIVCHLKIPDHVLFYLSEGGEAPHIVEDAHLCMSLDFARKLARDRLNCTSPTILVGNCFHYGKPAYGVWAALVRRTTIQHNVPWFTGTCAPAIEYLRRVQRLKFIDRSQFALTKKRSRVPLVVAYKSDGDRSDNVIDFQSVPYKPDKRFDVLVDDGWDHMMVLAMFACRHADTQFIFVDKEKTELRFSHTFA